MLRRLLITLALVFCANAVSPSQQQFRFAWLSDTHVGGSTGAEDLTRTVRDINNMPDLMFTVLSGDITEMGSDSTLALTKVILDSLKHPYYITPGNHDTKWSESGCMTFSRLWGNDKFAFEYGGYRFFGLHEGPIMKMGDGRFPPEDLRWLDSAIAAMADPHQPVFFITHYPLDPQLDNWYELIDRAKKLNTLGVLVGHGHRNRVLDFEGIPGVMGRSNLRARDSVGGYTIVEMRADSAFFFERITGIGTNPYWHSISLSKRSYAIDATKYWRPPLDSVNAEFPDVRVDWKTETGFTIAATPAVWKDVLVVGNSSGAVSGYSLSDGKHLWSFRTGGTVYSTPAIADGVGVIGSSDGGIYGFDASTGKVLWTVQAEKAVVSGVTIVSGVAYVGASDGVFRAINLRDGTLRWQYNGVEGFVETKPLVHDGLVIFGAWDSHLYALDAETGNLRWKWNDGRPGILYSPAACWPVATDGKVFIVAPDRFMTCIDLQTGATTWRSNRYQVRETIGISQDGSRVYARCMTDTVIAIDPRASEMKVIWEQDCRYGYDIDPSMPIARDGMVFFGTKNGLAYSLNAKTGEILWRHKIGNTIVSTPVPLPDNRVLVTDLDGSIVMLSFRNQ